LKAISEGNNVRYEEKYLKKRKGIEGYWRYCVYVAFWRFCMS